MNMTGLHKSAVFLLSIGQEATQKIFQGLSVAEIEKLGLAMTELKTIPAQDIQSILLEVLEEYKSRKSFGVDAVAFLRELAKTPLIEGAQEALRNLLSRTGTRGMRALETISPETIASLLKEEHPQIIATIIANLKGKAASAVIKLLNPDLANQVLLRLATMSTVQQLALKELGESVNRIVADSKVIANSEPLGGVKDTAEIISQLGGTLEANAIASLRNHDVVLAEKIVDQMFTFDNMLALDDKAIQTILREAPSEGLITALKGVPAEKREPIFRNMGKRAAETLRDDIESRGPVKVSDVENEQKEILKLARRLASEGKLDLNSGKSDSYV